MGASLRCFFVRFCCCCEDNEPEEKSPILSETLQYFDREAKRRRAEETNLWSEPLDKSHMERDDDRDLYNLLQRRAKTRRGSQGYRRLSIDIHGKRQVRRDVQERWKMILENLGFHAEADSLLTVSSNCSYASLRHPAATRTLLNTLHHETSVFDRKDAPPERYLFVLDRLLILDAAEDFVGKARLYYPKEEESQDEVEAEPENTTPILVAQTNRLIPGEEEEELEDGSVEMDDDVFMSKSLE
ncbi:melanoregulin [Acipenser oxyrinchus oxyrinchus]|uniref:Melanoregulin n=1 Tax=Acipenser oxyrinchus oxyrinchus TaxID=40147 RepID=A0AAD8CYP4_ACIOX|nr:melanoregulin [Acipenser oxyrinchus oxyrinchus]